jgi:hypothetical protein
MMRKSVFLLMLVASLVIAACASPAMMPSKTEPTEAGEVFTVALPRIVLTANESGQLGVEGVPLDLLGLGAALPAVNGDFVAAMRQANIQHLELRHTGDGLAVIVNGMPLPHIAWGDESFKAIGDLLYVLGPQIGVDGEAMQKLLTQLAPIVERLGLSVAIKFPAAADAPEVPFATDDVALAAPEVVEAPPSAVAKFEVKYDDQGVPSIMGISARDIAALTGNNQLALAMSPEVIQRAQDSNIQSLQVSTTPAGLEVYINGVATPKIVWDQGMLGNAIDLWAQLNPAAAGYAPMIKQLAPFLTNTSLSILLHFPTAEGVAVIPVTMRQ